MAPASKFLLLATSALLGASTALGQLTDFLEFDPPILSVADVQIATEFKCRLKAPPKEKATIYWDTPGMKADNCSIEYTKDDWNQYKTVKLFPINQYTKVGNVAFNLLGKCHAPGSEYDRKEHKYPANRVYKKAVTCTSMGDPHYKTFGGSVFDYMTPGVHYLVKNDMLTIQTSQFQCSDRATCNNGVAIRYGETVVVISSNDKTSKSAIELRQASETLNGLKVTASPDKRHYLVELAEDGSQIEIASQFWNRITFLDVTVRLGGPYFQAVGGLCNVYEDGNDDGLVCADGKKTKSGKTFGDSWKVPREDNIFECGTKCAHKPPKTPGNEGGNVCTPPANPPPVQATSVVVIPTVITSVVKETYAVPATSTAVATIPAAESTSVSPATSAGQSTSAGSPATSQPATTAAAFTTVVASTVVYTTEITQVVTSAIPATTAPATPASTNPYFTTCTALPKYTPPPGAPASTDAPAQSSSASSPASTKAPTQSSSASSPAETSKPEEDDTVYLPGAPKEVPRPPTCPEQFYNEATAHCAKLLDVPGCDSQVDKAFYVTSCVKDAIRTGSFIFAEGTKSQMLANCRAKTDAQKCSTDPEEKKQAEQVQKDTGLGDNACPAGCGENGTCTPNGCVCKPGFTGLNCETDAGKLPTYDTPAPVTNDAGEDVEKKPDYKPAPVPGGSGSSPASSGSKDGGAKDTPTDGTTIISGAGSIVAGSLGAVVAAFGAIALV